MLDCSVGAVKSAMSRALAKLRDDPRLEEFTERRAL
jgi:DNA-directed RNA polymerase specialized sigma24 family protein